MAKYSPYTFTDGLANDVSAARLNAIGAGIREASMGRSTTFPSSPVDGDIHVYPADTTNGVMWLFMYRSAVNDWEFIGGAPLFAEVTTAETTASATYAALATAGPAIALPFIGDWMVEIGCLTGNSTATAVQFMSYDIGGTGAVDADSSRPHGPIANNLMTAYRQRRKQALTAVTLTAKYKVNAGTGTFQDRWMAVTPIRHTP